MIEKIEKIKKMNPITIRNVVFGQGIPKICVPITGRDSEEILRQAQVIQQYSPDLVEWRIDWTQESDRIDKIPEIMRALRLTLGEIPLLATFRTQAEGGKSYVTKREYIDILFACVQSKEADIIDIEGFSELFSDESEIVNIIRYIQESHCRVIVSYHNFHETPDKQELIKRLKYMQQNLKADLLKIAVMPREKKDVIRLMETTEEYVSAYADRPVITMSMSGLGAVSRIAGELYGSALTFASVERASAPGQLFISDLRNTLNLLHNSR